MVFYVSFYNALSDLDDADRLSMYDAIMKYGLFGEVIDLPRHLRPLFTLLQPNIDASINRHIASVENGKNGGAPEGNRNASKEGKQPKKQPEKQPKNNHENDTAIDTNTAINKATDTATDIERENPRGGGSGEDSINSWFPSPLKDDRDAYKRTSDQEFEKMRQANLQKLGFPS